MFIACVELRSLAYILRNAVWSIDCHLCSLWTTKDGTG